LNPKYYIILGLDRMALAFAPNFKLPSRNQIKA
jgi:hypothetical protein